MAKKLQPIKLNSIKTFGDSMAPFFQDGDILFLKKVTFSKLKVNDFITFKKAHKFVTHRVVFKTPEHFLTKPYVVTKGDNSLSPDGRVYPNQIVGQVDQVKRGNRFIDPENVYLFQSSLYFQEITLVKDKLEKKGIDHVFLKGLPLHLYFEKTHPRRFFADCDLLINRSDLPKLHRILTDLGYQTQTNPLSPTYEKFKTQEVEIAYVKKNQDIPIMLDVHLEAVFLLTKIANLNALYPQKLLKKFSQELLTNRRRVVIQKQDFFILPNELLIVYLLLHIFHHNFRGYNRYELIKNILSKQKINYPLLAEIIVKYKLQNFIYPVIKFLQKNYHQEFKKDFFDSIKPSQKIRKFISKNIQEINIFEDELRIGSGVERFKNLFYLSPNSLWQRLFIAMNFQVLYLFSWVLGRKTLSQTWWLVRSKKRKVN